MLKFQQSWDVCIDQCGPKFCKRFWGNWNSATHAQKHTEGSNGAKKQRKWKTPMACWHTPFYCHYVCSQCWFLLIPDSSFQKNRNKSIVSFCISNLTRPWHAHTQICSFYFFFNLQVLPGWSSLLWPWAFGGSDASQPCIMASLSHCHMSTVVWQSFPLWAQTARHAFTQNTHTLGAPFGRALRSKLFCCSLVKLSSKSIMKLLSGLHEEQGR